MSFHTTYKIIKSEGLKERMIAAAAAAGRADAPMWVEQNLWGMVPLMTEPGGQYWWQVWEYCEAQTHNENTNPDIGARTDVILDAWIATVIDTYIDNQNPS